MNSRPAQTSTRPEPPRRQVLANRILYPAFLLTAALTCLAVIAPLAAAQEERPQIMPGERKAARKKDTGPRALAIVRISKGKTSLVPVAILVNGKFWDASAYKADPVPMALEQGTIYEAEHTGNSVGLFTISSPLHSVSANVPSPWIATGMWLPNGSTPDNQPMKAESVPVGIDNGDQPPRLTRDPAAAHPAPPSTPAPAAKPASPSSTSDDEPPRLSKPAPTTSAPDSTASAPNSTPSSQPGSASSPSSSGTPPAASKTDDKSKIPQSDSGAAAGYRPALRRGKPTGPLPEEEVPGYSKPGKTPPATEKAPAPAADEGPVQLIPAISDAGKEDLHSFGFTWLPEEENDRRKQMTDLAKSELHAYLAAQAKATTPPTPAKRVAAKKAPEPVLENAQMVAYDLWNMNQPVILFAADATMPAPANAPIAAADSKVQYTIMLVARTDIYNNLHKLYVGITDKYHLDITPRLELIDAVDADGDGRGELLFRETSDAGVGWILYKASADKLWKMYDSLHPE